MSTLKKWGLTQLRYVSIISSNRGTNSEPGQAKLRNVTWKDVITLSPEDEMHAEELIAFVNDTFENVCPLGYSHLSMFKPVPCNCGLFP
jgi:hypothetical protein